MNKEPPRNGFTLMELLVVLVLIALLLVVAVPQIARMADSARSKTAKIQLETVGQSLTFFQLDNGRFPSAEEGLAALMTKPEGLSGWTGPYVKSAEQLSDPWGRPLRYTPSEEGDGFELGTLGADGKAGGEGDDADLNYHR